LNFEADDSVAKAMRGVSSKFDTAYWREVCEKGSFPSEYWRAIGKAGLFGVLLDEERGGMGRRLLDLVLATEETAERFAGLGSYLFHSGALMPTIFARNPSAEIERKVLPQLASGKMRISIALAEEESGSDALSIKTTAARSSGDFVINGEKTFVTNADNVDLLLLFARTKAAGEGGKAKGISTFLVDPRSPGIEIRRLGKLGMDFDTICEVKIREVKVGPEALVGAVDEAWQPMRETFEMDRILTAGSLVGTGKLALNLASAHAKGRTVFGKAVGSYQGVQFPLADAMAQLMVSETAVLKAASLADAGNPFSDWANIALLLAQGAAGAATDRAVQAFGGHGYLKEGDVERLWRDVRAHRLHPISEELLLSQIAKRALDLPSSY
jgi:acyl-CoA dehydrogenase